MISFPELIGVNREASSYNVDEGRQKDDDDGEDAHQGAIQPRLDDPFGKSLQRDWEELGMWGKAAGQGTGRCGLGMAQTRTVQFGRRRSKKLVLELETKTKTHPETAVDSGDEHDGHEDDEAAEEEAHHHTGSAGRNTESLSVEEEPHRWLALVLSLRPPGRGPQV